jgi:HD-GYP domain-containing protein (c-di-GMP phosphodiesterase class II)
MMMNFRLGKDNILNIMRIAEDISHIRDLDSLLDRVLGEARSFTEADAGSIYLVQGDELTFDYVQNDSLSKRDLNCNRYLYNNDRMPISHCSIAGYVAITKAPLIIDDVYKLKSGVPYGFNRSFDEKSSYRTKAVMTIPLITSQERVIGVMQIINPKNGNGRIRRFKEKDKLIVSYFANHAAIAIEKALMTREIILRMIQMSQMRDPTETPPHVNRVGAYSIEIYHQWALNRGVPLDEIKGTKDRLRIAAMLHDVGKIGVSDVILKKNGSLDKDESQKMKMHTVFGGRLFLGNTSDWDEMAATVAINHHEKWDGSGYPGHIEDIHQNQIRFGPGKRGNEIPLFARIVALADVYDALMSQRYYKAGWTEQQALDFIQRERGRHFDPQLTDTFFSIYDIIKAIQHKYNSRARSGI